jgi:hypothetical protein
MFRSAAAAACALAMAQLAGCGEPEPAPVDDNAATEVNYQERLQTMDEGARNATFIRAIRDADFPCQGVTASSYQGETNGAPTWTATCDDGSSWTIFIGEGGVAQVAPSAAVEAATAAGTASNQAQ